MMARSLTQLAATKKRAQQILERLRAQTPEPRCELYYESPFQLLVSVVLSAQTTDKMVNRCMQPLYQQGFTPQTVLELGEAGLLQLIRSIGLAPTKAKNVYALSRILLTQGNGLVPSSRAALEALPGVGRKTASVVLAEIFGEPTLAVDTHVLRVGQRLGLHQEKTPLKAESAMLAVLPRSTLPAAHHWLILHGRYTCKAIKPLCQNCLLADLCPSREHLMPLGKGRNRD